MKVLCATRYSFEDEKTKRKISGCKVTYIGETEHSERFKGAQVITVSADEEVFHSLPKLPADLNLNLQVSMRQGSPTVRLMGINP